MYLSDITTYNEHLVNMIYPGDIEKYWVHYNSYWWQNSQKKEDIECKLVYRRDEDVEPVGIVAYGAYYRNEALTMSVSGWYELIHLVIDKKHQRKGYGEAVMCLIIEILRHKPDCQEIVIAHNPKNVGARRLYQKLGFVEFDYSYDGDPLMKLERS